jgi:hypothetical protein
MMRWLQLSEYCPAGGCHPQDESGGAVRQSPLLVPRGHSRPDVSGQAPAGIQTVAARVTPLRPLRGLAQHRKIGKGPAWVSMAELTVEPSSTVAGWPLTCIRCGPCRLGSHPFVGPRPPQVANN